MSRPPPAEDPNDEPPRQDGGAGSGGHRRLLDDALAMKLPNVELGPPVSSGGGSHESEQLEEIAEDMLHLLERLRSLEQSQVSLLARFEEVVTGQRETARELRRVREELLGERKATAVLSLFAGLVQRVDSVRGMLRELDPKEDARTVGQLTAVDDILTLMIRGLGFAEFRPEWGDTFDPHRMECVGYVTGEPDIVLEVVRAGYEAGGTVARPAHVRIAEPSRSEGITPR